MVTVGALVALGIAWGLLLAGIEPVPTWFYVFAWYPTLVLLDDRARRRDGGVALFARPRLLTAMAAWSVCIWLVFEAANFRLQNWYYVFLPDRGWERWLGITVSFATVVPAVVTAERWLRAHGIGRSWHGRPLTPTGGVLHWATGLGLAMGLAALTFPQLFFPLVWGAAWLLADPIVYRRAPEWSLLRDGERGEWGRIGRLLLGGLMIGFIWEFYNAFARGKWIYTVPWLEHTKLFEMPPLGFLGFPFFALEAWAMYHVLASFGLAPTLDGTWRPRRAAARGAALMAGAAVGVIVLLGMEGRTISSTTPRLDRLPDAAAVEVTAVRAAGYASVFAVADADGATFAERVDLARDRARTLHDAARLVALRGIGAAHAESLMRHGIVSVCSLARATPRSVVDQLRAGHRPNAAEVRVWVGAARRACPTWSTRSATGGRP
jgi:predicted flap endonuclease-1-like 5' DNA nuclease